MNSFTYSSPTRMIFGKDALDHLGAELKANDAKKVLVLYGGGSTVKSGVLGNVTEKLKAAGISYVEKGGVQPNPILSFLYECIDFAKAEKVDFILAVGGGSTIDTAKGISLALMNPEDDVWDFYTRKKAPVHGRRIGCVLTIAAAGSENSDSSVITNTETKEKLGMNFEYNRPAFAVLNPEFTYTLPKYQVACGVVDILMHTYDRYFTSEYNNDLTNELAEGLIRTVMKYGKTAVDCSTDYEAMSEIMWAGSVSHNGLTGLGAARDFSVHRLGRDLSAIYDCAHGATLSVSWVGFAYYTLAHDTGRFARYGRKVFGLEGDDATVAKEAIDKTRDFFVSLNMPITLTELLGREFTEQEVEELALACSANKTQTFGCFYNFTYEDVKKLYASVRI
ncbi:MAG: iron-containing alcohol dehydrogenase [Eubacteriales bacterium]